MTVGCASAPAASACSFSARPSASPAAATARTQPRQASEQAGARRSQLRRATHARGAGAPRPGVSTRSRGATWCPDTEEGPGMSTERARKRASAWLFCYGTPARPPRGHLAPPSSPESVTLAPFSVLVFFFGAIAGGALPLPCRPLACCPPAASLFTRPPRPPSVSDASISRVMGQDLRSTNGRD